nr:CPCC family cysteine-rich protein [uncultured Dysosmobacter sp.]
MSEEKRLKKLILPKVRHRESPSPCQRTAETPAPGKYPCPCCGCKTFPVPAADALAYICPVCMWENDVFTASDDEPSDENRGMTLNQGRAAYRRFGAVREEFLQYARPPLPEELP